MMKIPTSRATTPMPISARSRVSAARGVVDVALHEQLDAVDGAGASEQLLGRPERHHGDVAAEDLGGAFVVEDRGDGHAARAGGRVEDERAAELELRLRGEAA